MIRARLVRLAFPAVFAALAASGAIAQSDTQTVPEENEPVVFVPPAIGTPSERVGAGTRDAAGDLGSDLTVLVPEGGGLTTMEKPPLIWRMTSGFDGVMQAQIGPVSGGGVVRRQAGRFPPGCYGLDLGRSDFSLVTGEIYRWQVRLIDEATNAIVAEASGLVERVEPPERATTPAQDGLWYDALAPYVSVGLSGRARVIDAVRLGELAASAGIGE